MKLTNTWLCMDCGEVFDGRRRPYCPACASASTHPVSAWLNRPGSPAPEMEEEETEV